MMNKLLLRKVSMVFLFSFFILLITFLNKYGDSLLNKIDETDPDLPKQNVTTQPQDKVTEEEVSEPIEDKQTNENLILVNKSNSLQANYIPKELIEPNVQFTFQEDLPKKLMRREAAYALEELFNAAKDEGLELWAQSGYRSYDTQKIIFTYNSKQKGKEVANETSAMPGQSEHQTGLAMDVTSEKVNFHLVESFGETKEGKWLADHAFQYGFIIRYPKGKEKITGYRYEPWHIRYTGKKAAEEITKKNLTLEEYLLK